MDTTNLNINLTQLDKIDPKFYWPVKKKMNVLDLKKIVTLTLEEEDTVACGHCGSLKFVKNGRKSDLQRYKCKTCGKNFNILTGTPLARLKKKGRWLNFSECLNIGFSVRKSATEVGVDKKTAFKWRHRFLKNANQLYAPKLSGIVESKEIYFKYSEKGAKVIKNPSRLGEKVFVLTSVDRDRLNSSPVIEKLESDYIKENVNTQFVKDSLFLTESHKAFINFSKSNDLNHFLVNNETDLSDKDFLHIKNAIKYNFDLKEWMKRFRGVATKYLSNYLSWYRELDEYFMRVPSKVFLVRGKSLERFPYNPKLE
jgi:transposase-like protein